MKAVILAGGKGTRIKELSQDIPKPMLKIGNTSILEHQIRLLRKYEIREIIIITGHLSDIIENYFKDGNDFDVGITYFREKKPLGTTGGIKEIENKLNEDFIVFYGDIMLNMNVKKLVDFHKKKRSFCTLVLHPNDHPYDSDLVEIDGQKRIIKFHPKPHNKNLYYKNLVNAGMYVMSPQIANYIEKGMKADFGKDLFPRIVNKEHFYGYITAEYIKDIGTSSRLEDVRRDYTNGKIERYNIENKRKAIFLDRDGTINKEVDLLHNIEDFDLFPTTCKAIKKINKSDYLAIVVSNQPVVARNLCTIEDLEEIHKKMETLLGKENAKLDSIYYCPHHPDSGYPEENPAYKVECECRKPNIGMIKTAANEFNIDLDSSYIIGDSVRDIKCGKNAGLITIGLRTGKKCKDGDIDPDYYFEDLYEAASYVVDEPYKIYLEDITNNYLPKHRHSRPFVISIGGNSRSGKTILSQYLNLKFIDKGMKILRVSLDNWIIPVSVRKNDQSVHDRFQLNKINEDIDNLFRFKEIRLKEYNPLTRSTSKKSIFYKLKNYDIVIIEGIVALSSAIIRKISHLKFFCEIDKNTYRERFLDYYSWKGLQKKEIEALYKARYTDEYILIERDKRYADFVVMTKSKE